jgi:hypothetical protein
MAIDPMDTVRGCEFWRDGCRTMAAVICATLSAAKEPITPRNIIRFLHSLPRKHSEVATEEWQKSYSGLCVERAYKTLEEPERGELAEYFLRYFPDRFWMCQATMIDGFVGLLEGISWEEFQCPTSG